MTKLSKLNPDMPKSIEDFSRATLEFLTGLATGNVNMPVSLGHIGQRIIAGEKLNSVMEEIKRVRELGKLDAQYSSGSSAKYTFLELINFFESSTTDEERFELLKKIFITSLSVHSADSPRDELLIHQYMLTVKELTAFQSVILAKSHHIATTELTLKGRHISEHEWLEILSKELNIKTPEIILVSEIHLVRLGLLNNRIGLEKKIYTGTTFALTMYGYSLIEYANKHDSLGL